MSGREKLSAADAVEHRVETPRATDEDLLKSGLKEGFTSLLPFSGLHISPLERRDGKLEVLTTNFERATSEDGGRTWRDMRRMDLARGARLGHGGRYAIGWIRLPSGRVGMAWTEVEELPGRHRSVKLWWRTSQDDGGTWSEDVLINPTGEQGQAYGDTLRVTSSGRLLLPVRVTFSAGERFYETLPKGAGWYRGKKVDIEGHGHFPEMDITYVYYSDDEGKTWSKCEGYVMGWPYHGWGNYVACDEPNLEELKDGRLIMLMRTTVGRLLVSFSEDGGEHWSIPEPTPLASSYSPCALKRIPGTGDLLCVWNQVDADEIRLGYRRGRLSCAISEDGLHWKHFHVLEEHGILAERGRNPAEILPEEKMQLCRALWDVGELHPDWGTSDYPSIAFWEDKVLIAYHHLKGVGEERRGCIKLRILPVKWLYEN